MNMNFGFDVLFFAIIGLTTVGSFFIGEEKSQRLMIGVIVGSFAASEFSAPLTKFASDKLGFINQTIVAIVIMVLCVVICLIGKNVRDKKWPRSKIKAVISGILAGLVAVSFVIATIEPTQKDALVTDHNLAALAYDLRLYLAGALIIWLFVTYLTVGKAKR